MKAPKPAEETGSGSRIEGAMALMSDREVRLAAVLVLGAVLVSGLAAASIAIFALYRAGLGQARQMLHSKAMSLAETMESVTRHSKEFLPAAGMSGRAIAESHTLSQILEAQQSRTALGRTGEFVVGLKEDGGIRYILRRRHEAPSSWHIGPDADIGVPMRLALEGGSGTIITRDYRGATVLAAYHPVRALDLGLVTKVDLAELREPYLRAAGISLLIILLLLPAGAALPAKQAAKLVDRIRKANAALVDSYRAELTLSRLLRLGMGRSPLNVILDEALGLVVSVPWLSLERKGGIFLRRGDELCLAVHQGDIAQLRSCCEAASSGEGRRSGDIPEPEQWPAETGRGLCLPIRSGGRDLGVICLYRLTGAEPLPANARFLRSAADVLAVIIDRRRTEEALQESDTRFRQMAESVDCGFWLADPELKAIHYVNCRLAELWGRSVDEMMRGDGSWLGFIHPKDRERIAGVARSRIRSEPVEEEFTVVRPDGRERILSFRSSPVRGPGGETIRLAGITTDVTEARERDFAIERSGKQLLEVQRIAKIGGWEWDPHNDRGEHSRQFHEVFGLAPGTFDGSLAAFLALVHPEDRDAVASGIRRAEREKKPFELAYRIRRPDGEERHIIDRGETIRDKAGRVTRLVGTVQDVTERRRLEEIAQQSEKLSAVGQLAAGVAHELNNPLGVILGFAQSAARRIEEGDRLELPIRSIEREALRCKGLVQNLLAFSRKTAGDFGKVDLSEAVREVLSLVEIQVRVRSAVLDADIQPDLWVNGSSQALQQVVINLAGNALDAMERGGRVSIGLRREEAGSEPRAVLSVQDTGKGIPKDVQRRMFEPFFTTKEVGKGTGLGLSLVHETVTKHGGTIQCDSGPSRGTLFTVHLPLIHV